MNPIPAIILCGSLAVCGAVAWVGTVWTQDSHPECAQTALNATSRDCIGLVAMARVVGAALVIVGGPVTLFVSVAMPSAKGAVQ